MSWSIDYDKVALAAKLIGLAFTAGLGVVGTVTDTKERTPAGGYKVTRTGWRVVTAILLSSVIGGLGQRYEELARKINEGKTTAAEKEQMRRLVAVTNLSARAVARFSGQMIAAVTVTVPLNQAALVAETSKYDRELEIALKDDPEVLTSRLPRELAFAMYGPILANATFDVRLLDESPDARPPRLQFSLFHTFVSTSIPVRNAEWLYIESVNTKDRTLTVVYSKKVDGNVRANRLFSVADFGDARALVLYHCFEFNVTGTRRIRLIPRRLELVDSGFSSPLTEAALNSVAHGRREEESSNAFQGITKQLVPLISEKE
jgi:hypothetical protein